MFLHCLLPILVWLYEESRIKFFRPLSVVPSGDRGLWLTCNVCFLFCVGRINVALFLLLLPGLTQHMGNWRWLCLGFYCAYFVELRGANYMVYAAPLCVSMQLVFSCFLFLFLSFPLFLWSIWYWTEMVSLFPFSSSFAHSPFCFGMLKAFGMFNLGSWKHPYPQLGLWPISGDRFTLVDR